MDLYGMISMVLIYATKSPTPPASGQGHQIPSKKIRKYCRIGKIPPVILVLKCSVIFFPLAIRGPLTQQSYITADQ